MDSIPHMQPQRLKLGYDTDLPTPLDEGVIIFHPRTVDLDPIRSPADVNSFNLIDSDYNYNLHIAFRRREAFLCPEFARPTSHLTFPRSLTSLIAHIPPVGIRNMIIFCQDSSHEAP